MFFVCKILLPENGLCKLFDKFHVCLLIILIMVMNLLVILIKLYVDCGGSCSHRYHMMVVSKQN